MSVSPNNRRKEKEEEKEREKPLTKRLDFLDLSSFSTKQFEIAMAASEDDILAAQGLRYRVFFEERSAEPTKESARCRLDLDAYDHQAEHVLIREREHGTLVACCRLMQREHLPEGASFYSESEFDLSPILAHPLARQALEISRACVAKDFRTLRVPDLFFRALGYYSQHHKISLVFGCGSFPCTDPQALSVPLSWMWHHRLAPEPLRSRALAHLHEPMNLIAKEDLTPQQALLAMPPLVKSYIRMGCFVGDGAVVDHLFKTTDILIIMPIGKGLIDDNYYRRYFSQKKDAE